jgi:hypothetical protein
MAVAPPAIAVRGPRHHHAWCGTPRRRAGLMRVKLTPRLMAVCATFAFLLVVL